MEDKYAHRKWKFEDIREVHKRMFLFRQVALEIFLVDGRNYLLTFWDTKTRDAVYNRIFSKASISSTNSIAGVTGTADPLSSKTLNTAIFGGSPLSELTQKWCQREISNFQYLMHLNTLAGTRFDIKLSYGDINVSF
jgi:hypothetical protein